MTIDKRVCPTAVALVATALFATAAQAVPVIWDGPRITFVKEGDTDPEAWMLPENQDRITDNVWITRGHIRGLFNAAVEDFPISNFASTGPAGTEWAVGTTDQGIETLDFMTWRDAAGGLGSGQIPEIQGTDFVVHLIEDDIYLDLRFLDEPDGWGVGSFSGGSFGYTRTTPIPEPASLGLLGAAVTPLALRRRRRR